VRSSNTGRELETAKANKPSGAELNDDILDQVAGGQLPKPLQPPDPCIK
jgi:hypothetical protein